MVPGPSTWWVICSCRGCRGCRAALLGAPCPPLPFRALPLPPFSRPSPGLACRALASRWRPRGWRCGWVHAHGRLPSPPCLLQANLTKSQNEFKIVLKELEDSLLARLSAASGNFLGDTALVENLETTKHTASEIEEKVGGPEPPGRLPREPGRRAARSPCCPPAGLTRPPSVWLQVQEAKITEVKINEARENYRPAAERASLLYFILNDLNKISPIYQFSLKVRCRPAWGALGGAGVAGTSPPAPQAFNVVFEKAIQRTVPADEVRQRVMNLTDEITYSVYVYTARGLFERDKLIFLAQVTFQVRPRPQPPGRACSFGARRQVGALTCRRRAAVIRLKWGILCRASSPLFSFFLLFDFFR